MKAIVVNGRLLYGVVKRVDAKFEQGDTSKGRRYRRDH